MQFIGLALLVAALGVIPLLAARRFKAALVAAPLAALFCGLWFYNDPPMLTNPLWGSVGILVVALWVGAAALVIVGQEEWSRVGFIPIAGVLLILGRLVSGWAAFSADDYSAMLGEVETRTWTEDVQPKDPKHIRLVPLELAQWAADKQLGEAPGAIGSQFTVDNERMTLQMVNGELWYVAPLDFKDFGAWTSADVAPGYVMVHGEDPTRQAVVKTGEKFAYMPNAYFGHNLHRHLWTHGYATAGLAAERFELDEEGRPWWVVTVYEPTIAWSGERVKGVVTVNPTDGATAFHAVGRTPEWIDRVYPPSFVHDYILWRGRYENGWWNAVWSKHGITEPESPAFVYGSDGRPYWVTDVTSTNVNDESLVGLMYTDTRTGKSTYYRAVGGTDQSVLKAVDNKVSYRRWHGASPVLYNMYGTMASIVPLLGENHTFQGVAIVKVDTLQVAVGEDLGSALREYQKILGGSGTDVTPDVAHSRREIQGVVDRVSADVRAQETTYYLRLKDSPAIFTGGSDLSPTLPLTRAGDEVTVTFIPSGEHVVPIVAFQNRSLPLGSASPPEAPR